MLKKDLAEIMENMERKDAAIDELTLQRDGYQEVNEALHEVLIDFQQKLSQAHEDYFEVKE